MSSYVARLYDFFRQLEINNNREWFKANRAEYDELRELWLADIDRLIRHMTGWYPEMAGLTASRCAYRIYRDTRFSLDKTPYKLYFSAGFGPNGKSGHGAGYYLQMGPGRFAGAVESGLYGGIWCPESSVLKKLRKAIVDNIEEFEEITSALESSGKYHGWWGERLKTIPKGYDRNHPQAELLRLKEYGRFMPADMDYFNDPAWPEKVADDFRPLRPMLDFFTYSLEEELFD